MSAIYLTTEETAELLRRSIRTVHSLTSSGRIPHRRIAGTRRVLFDPEELRMWLDGCPLETVDLGSGGRVVRPVRKAK